MLQFRGISPFVCLRHFSLLLFLPSPVLVRGAHTASPLLLCQVSKVKEKLTNNRSWSAHQAVPGLCPALTCNAGLTLQHPGSLHRWLWAPVGQRAP